MYIYIYLLYIYMI